ncbi:MAG: lysophospholipid acyltransferase family protein [Flammeovirgaceae bacterium]
MKKLFYWIFTIPFLLAFGLTLVIFHPLQVIAKAMGYQPHKKVVDGMCWCLLWGCLPFTLSRVRLKNLAGQLPTDRPLLIVGNHQSSFDIPMIGALLQKHHPKYISKRSLAKGIPSISYNIREGGSVTIDRKNPDEAVQIIKGFGEYLEAHNRSGCIFPEGTRAKDGKMKPFKTKGMLQLLAIMPRALVVPVAIENSWKLERWGFLPVPIFIGFKCTALPALEPKDYEPLALIEEVEHRIRVHIGQEVKGDS